MRADVQSDQPGQGARKDASTVEAFSERIGFAFRDPSLLEEALTHSSFANENPGSVTAENERLEYLGDAVLGFLVAEWLFRRYPDVSEGDLTSLRIFVVRSESLARLGSAWSIGQFLRMGRGEEASGGRLREANLCAAVEAFFGALYLDRGIEPTRQLVRQHLESLAVEIEEQRSIKNAKTYLQEQTQSDLGITPRYQIVDERGPDHERVFVAQVLVGEQIWGEGTGRSKRAAEQAAARAAIVERSL